MPVDEAKSKPFRIPAARVGVHAFIMCQGLAVAHYVSAFQHRSTDFELLLHKKNIYETTRSLAINCRGGISGTCSVYSRVHYGTTQWGHAMSKSEHVELILRSK